MVQDEKQSPAGKDTAEQHEQLVARLGLAVRRMGAQSVIASRMIAERFGLHTTDLEVLDLIFLRGEASAGDLAEATGLTSGSVTALIDRLVRAGYVERQADPSDRRRVLVRAREEAIEPIKAVYAPMQRRMFELWSSYSDEELRIVLDFVSRSTDLHVDCVKDVREEVSQPASKRRRPRTHYDEPRTVPEHIRRARGRP